MKKFFRTEEGQGMVEYGLILALISIAAIAIMPGVGDSIANTFTQVATALTGAGV